MPAQTQFADIQTCKNQKDSFTLRMVPAAGVDLTGSAVQCHVVSGPGSTTALLTPTVETTMVGTVLEVTFSWTQEQSAALPVHATTFTQTTSFPIEIDVAFADDLTHPAMRFISNLVVTPGGSALGT